MKTLLVTLVFISTFSLTFSQNSFTVGGKVTDENGEGLPSATIVLLQKTDSLLASFTSTNMEGNYELKRVPKGDYVFQVSFVGYEKYSKELSIDEDLVLEPIKLREEQKILDEIEVSDYRTPIEIKGDTIQYNAGAFKTKENAVVEDLLRKLPGVQVERDGSIRAHGERVNKLLVDGKEFFGNDPKLATRNLPADAIENVQVFDKASELAEFTGIEDGNEEKTINLSLKEDKKQGHFGTVAGGYGTDDRYLGKGNFNRFSGKLKLSAIGNTNNLNQETFSLEDQINFAGGIQELLSSGGGLLNGLSLAGSSGQNEGVRTARSGGINLNFEPNNKLDLNANYRLNYSRNNPNSNLLRQNFLNGEVFTSTEDQLRNTSFLSHLFNVRVKNKLNERSELIYNSNLKINSGDQLENAQLESLNPEGSRTNFSSRFVESSDELFDLDNKLTYRYKFNKPGRFLVANAGVKIASNDQDYQVQSENLFFLDSVEIINSINQLQNQSDDPLNYNIGLNYTEPVGKNKYLEFALLRNTKTNHLNKDFFDVAQGEVLVRNNELSNGFERDYTYYEAGLRLKVNRKNSNLSFGAKAQNANLEGDLDVIEERIDRTFFNILPSVNYNLEINNSQNFRLSYSTRIQEPSIQQLQPIVDNSNPILTYVGNPNLQPEYIHDVSLNYNLFDQFNFITFFSSFRASIIENRIINSRTINEQLQQEVSPINTNNSFTLNAFTSFSTPIRPLKVKVNLSPSLDFQNNLIFINNRENTTRRFTPSVKFEVENRKKEKIDWLVGTRLNTTNTTYSLDSELNQKFFRTVYYTDVTYNFLESWELNVSFNYERYGGSAFPNDQNIPILNAYLAKSFLKNKKAQLKVEAFDLLEENVGISRRSNSNFIEESRFNTLTRYFLFTLSYKLGSFGGRNGGLNIKVNR